MDAPGYPACRHRFRRRAAAFAAAAFTALAVPAVAIAAEARAPHQSGLVELYWTGGVFMHPILLCSVVGLALIVERAWFFARARTDTKRLMTEVLRALQDQGLETAASIEIALLERGLIWLATVANIAPLLGFLGTVSGMIHAFEAIAAAEEVSAKLVATGIYEALITTAAGLIVAIPVQAAHNYFVSRIDKFVIDIEESGAELIDALTMHSKQWEHFLSTIHVPGAPAPR
jgi:biopolymer transport protein ExbB